MAAPSSSKKLSITGVATIFVVAFLFRLAKHPDAFRRLQLVLNVVAVMAMGLLFYFVRKADNARLAALKASLADRPPISDDEGS